MNAALIVIDLQNDFLSAPGLRPSARAVTSNIRRLLDHWRACQRPICHVVTTVERGADNRMPHWKSAGIWKCVAGTPGHAAPSTGSAHPGEGLVHKSGYSGFQSGALNSWLRENAADAAVLCGLHTHACVRATAIDALLAGLNVSIPLDATGTDQPLHGAASLRYLSHRGVELTTVDALLSPVVVAPSPAAVEVDAVVRVASAAQLDWSRQTPSIRASLLRSIADAIDQHATALADQVCNDVRKPIHLAIQEVARAAALARLAASLAADDHSQATPSGVLSLRRPHGVVACITPFNNPVAIPLGKLAPALTFGNAVVWKPAPEGRGVARAIQDLVLAAGLPTGLLGLVEGGRESAIALCEHDLVAAVSISGSESAGVAVHEVCAQRGIPVQAELGGNNAAIVWSDADLPAAASLIAEGAFGFAGQRCTATRRVIVDSDCMGLFMPLLLDATSRLNWGDPRDPAVRIGPVISSRKRASLAELVSAAEADGLAVRRPHLEQGGPAPKAPDAFAPAIITCPDPRHEIVQEESFGPILVVQPASGLDHALRLCNGARQGLAAAVFTRSEQVQARFLQEACAGVLKVNRATADAATDAPFGGWKASGIGPPEHGAGNLEFYTRAQAVYR